MSCNCGKKQEQNLNRKIEFKEVYSGFKNLIISNPEILDNVKMKANYCNICKFKKESTIFKYIKDDLFPEIQGCKCMLCGCSLSAKLRSNSKCPIGEF